MNARGVASLLVLVIAIFEILLAGIIRALAAAGLTSAHYVLILGGGATAASAPSSTTSTASSTTRLCTNVAIWALAVWVSCSMGARRSRSAQRSTR